MLGQTRQSMTQVLMENGFAADEVGREIDAAQASPYVRGGSVISERVKKREWLLKSYAKLAAQYKPMSEIPREHKLPAETFYADYYFRHRPVLLTGLMDHWPALKLWSLDHFETKVGRQEIEVQFGRENDPAYEIQSDSFRRKMTMAEFIALLRRDEPSNDFYMTANNDGLNQRALAGMWGEAGQIDGYLDSGERGGRFFWMGPKGTITPFHHDLTNNLLVQVRGRKRVRMVASFETPLMRNHLHCYSEWDLQSLEPAGVAKPTVFTCDLGPGEALFLPVGWWHHVEAMSTTIGLSFTNFLADNDYHSFYETYGPL